MSSRRPVARPEDIRIKKKKLKSNELTPNQKRMFYTTPNPDLVHRLSPYLLPISPEEVMYREAGESALLDAVGTTVQFAALGTLIGCAGYGFSSITNKDQKFQIGGCIKSGLTTGISFGIENGMSTLISSSIANYRGRHSKLDPIIGGAVAGAVVKIPYGGKAMLQGAAQGASFATLLVGMQFFNEML